MVAVKYVFTDENCSQADIDGFTRIAIETQPTSIWLTFDFHTICTSKGITKPALLKRLEKQINAYADMFISLKTTGWTQCISTRRTFPLSTPSGI